jgi:hypothetical protein
VLSLPDSNLAARPQYLVVDAPVIAALILERQRQGITAAKARGAHSGRKPALSGAQARSDPSQKRPGQLALMTCF